MWMSLAHKDIRTDRERYLENELDSLREQQERERVLDSKKSACRDGSLPSQPATMDPGVGHGIMANGNHRKPRVAKLPFQ